MFIEEDDVGGNLLLSNCAAEMVNLRCPDSKWISIKWISAENKVPLAGLRIDRIHDTLPIDKYG